MCETTVGFGMPEQVPIREMTDPAMLQELVRTQQEEIAALKLAARHASLLQRDYIIGIESQLGTARNDFLDAGLRFQEISEGFGTALDLLAHKDAEIASLNAEVSRLRKVAKRARIDGRKQRVAATRRVQDIQKSRSWRVGRAITSPFRIFSRR